MDLVVCAVVAALRGCDRVVTTETPGGAMTLHAERTAGDEEAILAPARDYIESWLDGDADRMAGCLHPDLVKRAVDPDSASGVYTMSRDDMVAGTASGRGTTLERAYDVALLDSFGDIATVRVLSAAYMDYLHVARVNDRWLIVNVLWKRRTGT